MPSVPNFAIICPSRGRPGRYAEMRDSAMRTASNPGRVTVHIGLDADDPSSDEYDTAGAVVTVFTKRRGVPALTQSLMDSADADFLMLGGDDCIYRTQGWDEKIVRAFDKHIPGRLGMISFDNGNGRTVPEAMCASREWADAAHPLFMPRFEHFWADAVLLEIVCRFERLFCLKDVCIEHMHFKYGKAPIDATYARTRMGGLEDRDKKVYEHARPEIEAQISKISEEYGLTPRKEAATWRSHYRQSRVSLHI